MSRPQSGDGQAQGHIAFLNEVARYFENRPTGGEDRAHWSNVFNAKNCREIAAQIAVSSDPLRDMLIEEQRGLIEAQRKLLRQCVESIDTGRNEPLQAVRDHLRNYLEDTK